MPPDPQRDSITVQAERTVLAAVRMPGAMGNPADPFGELTALAEQAGAVVVGELEQMRQRPEAGTYMGSGKVIELRDLCERLDATVVIFDHDLSPSQIGNIEKIIERKVLDRSELILDIFASRATTHQARLQVELAQLEYTYPRLRAMWSHLERIVGSGGIGGVGTRGPGEQQLEIDRRIVQKKKTKLRREMAEIQARKRREVKQRTDEHFTVGIVGYTNAGKSTLFNTLTAGGAYADDRLFATLMTRTRVWEFGGGISCMLSDTVGFVRDLPHHLVASFRATLEEATHADLLLVVLDIADPAVELHYETVTSTLDELMRDVQRREPEAHTPRRLVLLNKADRLGDNRETLIWQQREPDAIALCSVDPKGGGSGLGLEELRDRVLEAMRGRIQLVSITVPLADSRTVHVIENRGEVLDRKYEGDVVTLRARIGQRQLDELRARGAQLTITLVDE